MRSLPLSSKSIRSSSLASTASNSLSLAYVVRHCKSVSTLDPERHWTFWQMMHTALQGGLLMRDVRKAVLVDGSTAGDAM